MKNIAALLQKNSTTVLTVFAAAGVITTTVLAVKATPKAIALLQFAEYEKNKSSERVEEINYLTPKETFLTTYKCYIPAAIMGTLTIGCILSANTINIKRNAALASVYALTETSLKEYQSKVTEMIGPAKAREVKDAIMKDRVEKNPPKTNELIITGKGDVLCMDALSGRYFKSDIEDIRRNVNEFNRDMMSEMFMSLNDLYYRLGLCETQMGTLMGWHVDNGLLDITFSSQLTPDGTPCLVLDYSVEPRYTFVD